MKEMRLPIGLTYSYLVHSFKRFRNLLVEFFLFMKEPLPISVTYSRERETDSGSSLADSSPTLYSELLLFLSDSFNLVSAD